MTARGDVATSDLIRTVYAESPLVMRGGQARCLKLVDKLPKRQKAASPIAGTRAALDNEGVRRDYVRTTTDPPVHE